MIIMQIQLPLIPLEIWLSMEVNMFATVGSPEKFCFSSQIVVTFGMMIESDMDFSCSLLSFFIVLDSNPVETKKIALSSYNIGLVQRRMNARNRKLIQYINQLPYHITLLAQRRILTFLKVVRIFKVPNIWTVRKLGKKIVILWKKVTMGVIRS